MKSINHKGRKDFRKGRKEMKNADLTLCTLCLFYPPDPPIGGEGGLCVHCGLKK